jgi:hypothetical protein
VSRGLGFSLAVMLFSQFIPSLTHFSPLYSFEYGLYNSSWKIVGFEFIEKFLVTVYSDFLETAIMNVLFLPCFLCIQCNFEFSLEICLILCARSN